MVGTALLVIAALLVSVGLIVAADVRGLGTRHEQWLAYVSALPWMRPSKPEAFDVEDRRARRGWFLIGFGLLIGCLGMSVLI